MAYKPLPGTVVTDLVKLEEIRSLINSYGDLVPSMKPEALEQILTALEIRHQGTQNAVWEAVTTMMATSDRAILVAKKKLCAGSEGIYGGSNAVVVEVLPDFRLKIKIVGDRTIPSIHPVSFDNLS